MKTSHIKRLSAPNTWQIKRKGITFITRPNPGQHSFKLGMPLIIILREVLKYGKTAREIKNILNKKIISVDGIRRKDPRLIAGLFDVVGIEERNEYYRIMLNKKGKIALNPIDKSEAQFKPCKIIGKSKLKEKIQLNLYDGKNILVDKDSFKVGDSLIISLPKPEIKNHLKLEKNNTIYLTGGKHVGDIGIVEDIKDKNIFYKSKSGEVFETSKKYAFVIGNEKPLIKAIE